MAVLTRQGVSMGDHAQDITSAVLVADGMTVQDLVAKALTSKSWDQDQPRTVDADSYLTLRIAVDGYSQ